MTTAQGFLEQERGELNNRIMIIEDLECGKPVRAPTSLLGSISVLGLPWIGHDL